VKVSAREWVSVPPSTVVVVEVDSPTVAAPSIAGAATTATVPRVCPADTVHWRHSSITDCSTVPVESATTA